MGKTIRRGKGWRTRVSEALGFHCLGASRLWEKTIRRRTCSGQVWPGGLCIEAHPSEALPSRIPPSAGVRRDMPAFIHLLCKGPISQSPHKPASVAWFLSRDRSLRVEAQVDWTRFLRELGADIAVLDKFSEVDVASSVPSPFQGLDGDELEQQLGAVVQEIAQRFLSEDHSAYSPLMESGLDSLSAIDFRNSVAKELSVKLPSTLMFDHPTTKAVAAFAASLMSSKPTGTPAGPASQSSIAGTPFVDNEPLAVGSGACRFPLEGTTPRQMWDALAEKIDAVTEIPADRWDVDEYFDSDPEVPGKMTVRHGAFVKGADLFDAAFFGLSPVESKIMDPQQRLLLEVIYQSFHVAGMPMTVLTGMSACITVGQCHQDWGHVGFGTDSSSLQKIGPYTGLGVSTAVSSNRVSYLLGLKGPSVTVDTACSSSLVAVDIAVSTLRRGRSTVAASSRSKSVPAASPVRGMQQGSHGFAGWPLQDF